MTTTKKTPPPKPGADVTPGALPETEAALLGEVLDYADAIASADSTLDTVAMRKAEALEALYLSPEWSAEWLAIKPVKPDAVGRPVDPTSRNRFNEWLAWRAEKSGRQSLAARYTYRLLNARTVYRYLAHGPNKSATERAIRPLSWMLTRGYAERIPEVERIAAALANGGPITDKIMRKALSEWKRDNLGGLGVRVANRKAKAANYRPTVENDFLLLLDQDAEEAKQFLLWAAERFKASAAVKAVA